MNIVKENIDELNAVLKVKLAPTDYLERYNNALKKYQKKVDLPGFRPGKVPVDMVKKRFGKHILVEEINELLSESLHKYISENKIEILGNPLPKNNHVDFESETEYEFHYDLGLAPKMNIALSAKDKYPYYTVKADETLIGKHIDYFRRNFGQVISPETTEDKDMLIGDITEVDAQGQIVPGGIFKSTFVSPERFADNTTRQKLTGLKKSDKVIFSVAGPDAAYLGAQTDLPPANFEGKSFQFTLQNISRIAPADVNQDLFDKIYGPGKVNSEEEFKNKIKEELSVMFSGDSDRKFFNEVVESLMKKANLSLPENFLKRYMLATNRDKITADQVDKEYSSYSDALRWQLIENYLLKTHQLAVKAEEVEKFVSDAVKMNLVKRGLQNVSEEMVKAQVKKVLEDEKQVRSAYDRLYDQKLIELFKNTFTIEKKEIPYEEFFNNHKH